MVTERRIDLKMLGRYALISVAFISSVVNVLALTAPLFMLQIYDRVLASQSIPTLIGLGVLAAMLYFFQALLEIIRARILLRMGEKLDYRLSSDVYDAVVRIPLHSKLPGDGLQPLRDLDNVRGFLSGQGPTAFFDLPWMPIYLIICFAFHVWIGITALTGAIILIALTLITNWLTSSRIKVMTEQNITRTVLLDSAKRNAEVVRVLGLNSRLRKRWGSVNSGYLKANRNVGDITNGFGGASKTLRIMLQSAILGVGAFLVIFQETSPGVMIAASIMMGRALAPVDLAIANWKPFTMAMQSSERLSKLLSIVPSTRVDTELPPPSDELSIESLSVIPPGGTKPIISGVTFKVLAGEAVAILGPSGSGKSTLARAVVGAWDPSAGNVRIDGASLDQWDPELLGPYIGYLPQNVELFDGTVAENVARQDTNADADRIVKAAKAAGAHNLILNFPNGYDTRIGEEGSILSAGQRQRIGLARALYGEPFLVVLDEPNAHLDAEGEAELVRAIAAVRARKGIVLIIAHRPAAIASVDKALIIDKGRLKAFGPRDDVISKVLRSSNDMPASGNKSHKNSTHPKVTNYAADSGGKLCSENLKAHG